MPIRWALLVTSSGVPIQGALSPARQTLGQVRLLHMDRVSVWHALPYIGARLRALVLGSMPLARMSCSARAALIVSAATYFTKGILLLVGSVKTLSGLDIWHTNPPGEA